ncbi:S-adenosylmethionine:tRNA ribosyltransferase-isomerase [Campylobacterota bacterium]|nr:S-adenosylmethionine:tRNA ribosyltransferase-isomerase [Campylobacterota bacterium]
MSFALADYDYDLPADRIASLPSNPRSSAKLLVFDRASGTITHGSVADLPQFLPQQMAIIINNTRVFKARLLGKKRSGGAAELLIIREFAGGVLAQIRAKVRVGTQLVFAEDLSAEVIETHSNGDRLVCFYERGEPIDFARLLEISDKIGLVPLPPYIKRSATSEDVARYQSCFASEIGSVAAPTASLHFDKPLLQELGSRHKIAEVTLHIGLGTFKSVETADIRDHHIHSEHYQIGGEAARLIDSKTPLCAIGTTACRAVEYYARSGRLNGECDLFLHPANLPLRVGALLTNFHLPRSTLLMLVASFVGLEQTKSLYNEAIANNYRFYSYGDAMLIL